MIHYHVAILALLFVSARVYSSGGVQDFFFFTVGKV